MGAAAATRARAGCAAPPPFSKGGVIQPTSGEAWLHEIKHYRPKMEKRPPLIGSAGLLLFARFR